MSLRCTASTSGCDILFKDKTKCSQIQKLSSLPALKWLCLSLCLLCLSRFLPTIQCNKSLNFYSLIKCQLQKKKEEKLYRKGQNKSWQKHLQQTQKPECLIWRQMNNTEMFFASVETEKYIFTKADANAAPKSLGSLLWARAAAAAANSQQLQPFSAVKLPFSARQRRFLHHKRGC